MVQRLLQLVSGGQTAVNVNGEIGPFFGNLRGVRQGDSLSPILFDFMVDALAAMISKAGLAGHVRGVVPHLIPGDVTHLQYADDTMILIEPTELGIADLKLLLLSLENMSGLKINFNKTHPKLSTPPDTGGAHTPPLRRHAVLPSYLMASSAAEPPPPHHHPGRRRGIRLNRSRSTPVAVEFVYPSVYRLFPSAAEKIGNRRI
ncbi:hypothetical protein QYE76_005488 [Lolium multiflorum]|uniref:Reverse transcriptase domain-containing protein n=1 Tax=Lolium multiflorum TaxID=4521 RepID=A0AAD8W371_LOLMU|nr:hypothetical protein QYE76_005488 [Lolium multiflorum]